jgi:hypothetical protein
MVSFKCSETTTRQRRDNDNDKETIMTKKELMPHIRNFLCPASLPDMERELVLSIERGDRVRADCINDYINETICEDHRFPYGK